MGKPSAQLQAFMKQYSIDHDEIWEVRSGGAWAVKHSALERVAAEQKITFDVPQFAEKNSAEKIVAMLVVGHLGDRTEWSIGEASPANNKNSYCYAMAEKRGKDRVILKLLNRPGDVYSEEESDDFRRQNPHVTVPTDIVPDIEYDEHGEPVDNIPRGDSRIMQLSKKNAKEPYAKLQNALLKITTLDELRAFAAKNKDEVETLPSDWQATIRGQFKEVQDSLRAAMRETA